MPEDDPTATQRFPRPSTSADRDVLVKKHRLTAPGGIPIMGQSFDDLTPPPTEAPDEIEIQASRIEKRHATIQNRPGKSPSPESVSAAITIHAVKSELRQEIATVEKKLGDRIDVVGTRVGGVETAVGTLNTTNTKLVDELIADRQQRREIETTTVTTKHTLKVIKAGWVTKALAIVGAIGTAVATAIAAGRC